jgi:hypothetical protein
MKLSYLGLVSFDYKLENAIGKPDKLINTEFMRDLNIIIKNHILT